MNTSSPTFFDRLRGYLRAHPPSPEPPPVAGTVFEQFAELLNEKGHLEDRRQQLEERLRRLEPRVLEESSEHRLEHVAVRSQGRNLHVRRQVRARLLIRDRAAVRQALREADLEQLLKTDFHLGTLARFFAARLAPGAEPATVLPEPLVGKLELREVFRVAHTRCEPTDEEPAP